MSISSAAATAPPTSDPVARWISRAIAHAATAIDAIEIAIAGNAGAIEPVDLDRERVQQVRQRQPDGADLLPARRQAVEHPPRDDEMRARVVVREREAEAVVVDGRGGAEQRDDRRDRAAGAARDCEPRTRAGILQTANAR